MINQSHPETSPQRSVKEKAFYNFAIPALEMILMRVALEGGMGPLFSAENTTLIQTLLVIALGAGTGTVAEGIARLTEGENPQLRKTLVKSLIVAAGTTFFYYNPNFIPDVLSSGKKLLTSAAQTIGETLSPQSTPSPEQTATVTSTLNATATPISTATAVPYFPEIPPATQAVIEQVANNSTNIVEQIKSLLPIAVPLGVGLVCLRFYHPIRQILKELNQNFRSSAKEKSTNFFSKIAAYRKKSSPPTEPILKQLLEIKDTLERIRDNAPDTPTTDLPNPTQFIGTIDNIRSAIEELEVTMFQRLSQENWLQDEE